MRYCDIDDLMNFTIESMANEHNNILNLDLRYYGQVNDCFNSGDDGFMLVLEKLGTRYMTFLYPTVDGNINIRMYAGVQFHGQYIAYAMEHMARIAAAARRDRDLIPLKLDLDGNLYADAVFRPEGLSMEDARIRLEMDGLDATAILLDCFRDSFLDLANGTAPALMPYDEAKRYEEEENSSINHYLQGVFDIPTPGSRSWPIEKTPEEMETSDDLSLDDFFDNFDPGVKIVHADEDDSDEEEDEESGLDLPSDEELLQFLNGEEESA